MLTTQNVNLLLERHTCSVIVAQSWDEDSYLAALQLLDSYFLGQEPAITQSELDILACALQEYERLHPLAPAKE